MSQEEIKQKVNDALDSLYRADQYLFDEGLCERCITHRFAIHLEEQNFGAGYFVDCEYNRAHLNGVSGVKIVSNLKGNYIDIVITKRNGRPKDDLVCFETKRWNNKKGRDKDRANLEILTAGDKYRYNFGFYIIYGKNRNGVKIEIYSGGIKL